MKITNLNPFTLLIMLIMVISLTSCSKRVRYAAPSSLTADYISELSAEKQLAYRFVTAPQNESNTIDALLSDNFYSRDQFWEGDKDAFIGKRNADSSFDQIKPVRILQDESLVALHSRMHGDTLRFRWDIVRIADSKIQEHWSNINDSIGLSPNKHSEIDGPVIPDHMEQTDTNRAHIKRFIDQCMIREEGGAMKFFNSGNYVQHNRDVGDGLLGLGWAMIKMSFKGEKIKFKDNYHVIAEGNLVLSATEGFVGDEKFAFYDLFRIEENKIVEHWDIIAPIDKFLNYQFTGPKDNKQIN